MSGEENLSVSSPQDKAVDFTLPFNTSLFDSIFFSNKGWSTGRSVRITSALEELRTYIQNDYIAAI